MLLTGKKAVPYSWLLLLALPVCSLRFADSALGISFIFSLKKYADNPALLNLIISLPSFVALILGPVVGYVSDHIWTRFGRRKPFLVVSWGGMALSCLLLPLMPNFWSLVVVYMAYNLFKELGTTYEPLRQEIVPPHQRGRGGAAFEWFANITNMTFYFVALGRFDDVRFVAGLPIEGERAVYWSGALLLGVITFMIALAIKESRVVGAQTHGAFTARNFLVGLFDRQLWPIYILVFGQALLSSGLGPLGTLVGVELFGFTKQDMGNNVVIGGIINMFIIGFLALIADRLNRLKAYQILIGTALFLKFLYYVYIEFILPDRRATVVEAIVFGEALSIVGILTGLVYVPLAYEYVVRNKMGTYFAGSAMVTRLTTIITTNTVGLFVWGYSLVFQPAAGESVRVVLQQPVTVEEIKQVLDRFAWTLPSDGAVVGADTVRPVAWRASGPQENPSRCWEIRIKNPDSEKLATQKSDLIRRATQLRAVHEPGAEEEIRQAEERVKQIDIILDERAKIFQAQVEKALKSHLIPENGAIRKIGIQQIRLIEMATISRPRSADLETVLDELRRESKEIVDLRPIFKEHSYRLVLAVLDQEIPDKIWTEKFSQQLAKHQEGVLPESPAILSVVKVEGMSLDVQSIEEPLDLHPSPITRTVNWVLSLLGREPAVDRRLLALGRNLRDPENLPYVRAFDLSGDVHTIRIWAVPAEGKPALVSMQNQLTPAGLNFLEKLRAQTAAIRLTIPKAVLLSSYLPMKYDYMSGYLMMFVLGFIGLGITFFFVKMERRGFIRKLGLEEAEANQA